MAQHKWEMLNMLAAVSIRQEHQTRRPQARYLPKFCTGTGN